MLNKQLLSYFLSDVISKVKEIDKKFKKTSNNTWNFPGNF